MPGESPEVGYKMRPHTTIGVLDEVSQALEVATQQSSMSPEKSGPDIPRFQLPLHSGDTATVLFRTEPML